MLDPVRGLLAEPLAERVDTIGGMDRIEILKVFAQANQVAELACWLAIVDLLIENAVDARSHVALHIDGLAIKLDKTIQQNCRYFTVRFYLTVF